MKMRLHSGAIFSWGQVAQINWIYEEDDAMWRLTPAHQWGSAFASSGTLFTTGQLVEHIIEQANQGAEILLLDRLVEKDPRLVALAIALELER